MIPLQPATTAPADAPERAPAAGPLTLDAAPPADAIAALPPNERYQHMEPLATKGVTRVYHAIDVVRQAEVAVKTLRSTDAALAERFRLEARRLQALEHPHIVPLWDYGEFQGTLYLVMPYYPTTVSRELRRLGLPSLALVVRMTTQVAAALDYAHATGLIHRDVKPSNMLLDARWNAYLADFGIAKSTPRADSVLTTAQLVREEEEQGFVFSTPGYSAPEHLMGERVDARADVFGLGVVAYQLLTGKPPFHTREEATSMPPDLFAGVLVNRMLNQRPTAPSRLVNQQTRPLAAPVDDILWRALDPRPARRFASAGAFAGALALALGA